MIYEDDNEQPCGNCGEEAEEYATYRAVFEWSGAYKLRFSNAEDTYKAPTRVKAGSVWLCYDCAKRDGKER